MKKILFIITILSFTFAKAQVESIIPKIEITETPEINVISNSEIGLTLVSKESSYKYKAIKIISGKKVKMGFGSIKVNNGDIFVNKYNKKKYDLYESPHKTNTGIAINRETKEMKVYAINSGVYYGRIKNKIEFENSTAEIPNKEYFRQEFIYNGKSNNTVKFIYREFFENIARPAFTQELVYDINEDKVIGFKGLRIEVISCSNVNIEYKIVSYFKK
jgi:hypothetical protein